MTYFYEWKTTYCSYLSWENNTDLSFGKKKMGGATWKKKDLEMEGHHSASGRFSLRSLFKSCLQCSGKWVWCSAHYCTHHKRTIHNTAQLSVAVLQRGQGWTIMVDKLLFYSTASGFPTMWSLRSLAGQRGGSLYIS